MTKRIGFAFLLLLLSAGAIAAQDLRWGGDSEGGAPFVFQDPMDPRQNHRF
jgi:hypothetical protein